MTVHDRYMEKALTLARKAEGRTAPNPPVGALIVRNEEVVGEGFHPEAGQPHAEVFALRQAGELARGADLYVTLEPCSHHGRTGPCADAVIAAGLRRVFVGTIDPNPQVAGRGIARLEEAGIEVTTGIQEKACRRLIAPFAKHVLSGVPYVILKAAVTLDGRTATAHGDSKWITNEQSREYVHRLRDKVDAIMVGAGTALADNPRLTTRLPEGGRDPLRIVVDSTLRLDEQADLFHLHSQASTLVATTGAAPVDKAQRLRQLGAEVLVLPAAEGRVDLGALMKELGARGVQSLLLEGGARLNQAALEAGLVDRVMVFVAPKLLGGGDGLGIFDGPGPALMAEAIRIEEMTVRRFGDDVLLEGEVQRCSPD